MDKILAQLAAQIDKLGNAAWEQAPLVYRDILRAGMIQNAIDSVAGIGMIALAAWLGRKAYVWYVDDGEELEGRSFTAAGGAVVLGSIGLVSAYMGIENVLTIWLAPRAYLIHYLR